MEALKIVISGVNIVTGGPLSIYKDCLGQLLQWKPANVKVIALVHKTDLFSEFYDSDIAFIAFPHVKKRWLRRLWFEYITCFNLSKKLKADTWFSIHDVTPNVIAKKRIVYCHNPAPFYRLSTREAVIEKTLLVFKAFYRLLYGINITRNDFVIVQQDWIRERFKKWYTVKNIMVAYPSIAQNPPAHTFDVADAGHRDYVFLYPALPRVFKNFEVLFEAAIQLNKMHSNFKVVVTIDGTENKYARQLYKKYAQHSFIVFAGLQTRDELWQMYSASDCVVFPSKLETWGLPITEAILFDKPLLVANCNYAIETCGSYNKVCFFDIDNHLSLANLMYDAIKKRLVYNIANFVEPQQPFAENWQQVFSFMLS